MCMRMCLCICYVLYVVCYMLHVVCYMLHVVCYMLYAICHMSNVIGFVSIMLHHLCCMLCYSCTYRCRCRCRCMLAYVSMYNMYICINMQIRINSGHSTPNARALTILWMKHFGQLMILLPRAYADTLVCLRQVLACFVSCLLCP